MLSVDRSLYRLIIALLIENKIVCLTSAVFCYRATNIGALGSKLAATASSKGIKSYFSQAFGDEEDDEDDTDHEDNTEGMPTYGLDSITDVYASVSEQLTSLKLPGISVWGQPEEPT